MSVNVQRSQFEVTFGDGSFATKTPNTRPCTRLHSARGRLHGQYMDRIDQSRLQFVNEGIF
jgi:hypothetical protein